MTPAADRCLHCGRDAREVPLIPLEYRGGRWSICAQHLPVLIHDPARLIGQLPGAEGLAPAEHKD
jgi:hypothetical protein